MRAQAVQHLFRMNMGNASLIPDLEGLARPAACALEVAWERLLDDTQGVWPTVKE